ncbi:MAG: hydantoinase/oxoprolinase family protein [Pseudomonadota bacterium]
MIRVGADIGGTFTDIVLSYPGGLATAKVLTDYAAPERAILGGIDAAAQTAGIALEDIEHVIHGTTLVTNALIERRGARTVFITTQGFRDVIEMRSENRFEQYDLNLDLPLPLVPRQDRLTLPERIGPDGDVLLPLDPERARTMAQTVVAAGYEAVAIGFMHAYANDAHERMVAAALAEIAPDLPVSLSSVVAPRMRELPRFNTVIANAYVQPRVAAYLGRLTAQLAQAGIDAPVFLMHSGGGLISVETAAEQPVRLLESGPAGGAIFAAHYAQAHGIHAALSFDMGGTTAKICLIDDGRPTTANTFEVARTYRFKKGSGMVVSTPVIEMVEIGAGGGSIARSDALGRLQVGPQSAGSEPGPAAYQRGGTAPTVTDANLLLGRLDADAFAGGAIPLAPERAQAALNPLAQAQDLTLTETAFGVTELVDENMANAARVHSVENGRDIEHFTMVAFGGGAPLHACRQCEKLGIDACLIPPGAGVGSAIGFLQAPVSYEATRGLFQSLDAFDAARVNATLAAMEAEARNFVIRGAEQKPVTIQVTAYMRYRGQGWDIPVALPKTRLEPTDLPAIHAAFDAAYTGLFGRIIDGLSPEITNWSLTVSTTQTPPELRVALRQGEPAPVAKYRRLFDAGLRAEVEAAEIARADLGPGLCIDGPAIITEPETSTIVTAAFRAIGQVDGSILLIRKPT